MLSARVVKYELMAKVNEVLDIIYEKVSELGRYYTPEELSEIFESLARLGSSAVIQGKLGRKKQYHWNMEYLQKFTEEYLVPNTVILELTDRDILELLMFSIEFALSMIEGETRATKTQKGFRERTREVETIMVNTFIGMLGEVGLKRFIEVKFAKSIELDRTISRDIDRYHSDIKHSKEPISIKTTPNLKAVWAECPIGYSAGVFVKVSVPTAVFLSILARVCAFKRLVDFAKHSLRGNDLLERVENRFYYKDCGTFNSVVKCFICGYFETKGLIPIQSGQKLEYLGEVRESRYILPVDSLRWKEADWYEFITKYL